MLRESLNPNLNLSAEADQEKDAITLSQTYGLEDHGPALPVDCCAPHFPWQQTQLITPPIIPQKPDSPGKLPEQLEFSVSLRAEGDCPHFLKTW